MVLQKAIQGAYIMTRVDEKEILEIEALKASVAKIIQDTQLDVKRFDADMKTRELDVKRFEADMKRFDTDMKRFDIELSKKHYEAWRVALYGIAVGLGGTFAIAKTISLMGW
jgi:hypothetical protein